MISSSSSPLIAKAYDATLIKVSSSLRNTSNFLFKAVDVLKYVTQVTDISDGVVGDLSTFRGDLSASKNNPPFFPSVDPIMSQ